MVLGMHADEDTIEAEDLRHGPPRILDHYAISPAFEPSCLGDCTPHGLSQLLNQ